MAKVRERHWIPRLRRLVMKVVKTCHGCKRFQARALANPSPGNLQKDKTEGRAAFKVVGIDYAGPLKYRKPKKLVRKAHMHSAVCLQYITGHLPGVASQYGDLGVPEQPQEVHRSPCSSLEDLLRQWSHIRQGGKLDEGSDDR